MSPVVSLGRALAGMGCVSGAVLWFALGMAYRAPACFVMAVVCGCVAWLLLDVEDE